MQRVVEVTRWTLWYNLNNFTVHGGRVLKISCVPTMKTTVLTLICICIYPLLNNATFSWSPGPKGLLQGPEVFLIKIEQQNHPPATADKVLLQTHFLFFQFNALTKKVFYRKGINIWSLVQKSQIHRFGSFV